MCLGVPGELTEIYEADGLAMGRVNFSGVSRRVCLHLVPDARCGDHVLVHVGFALCRLDAEEAAKLTALLTELEQLEQLEQLEPEELAAEAASQEEAAS